MSEPAVGVLALLAAGAVFLLAGGVGASVLRLAGWGLDGLADRFLFSVGVGLFLFLAGTFVLGVLGLLSSVWVVPPLILGAVVCQREIGRFLRGACASAGRLGGSDATSTEIILKILLVVSLFVTGMISVAPLTGSDPMQYHFAFPKLFLKHGRIEPVPWDFTSFFMGPPHMAILLGMMLGTDRIALALNFGVVVLSAGAMFRLAQLFLPRPYPLAASVVLLVSPVTFWQATSGYIDYWGAYFAVLTMYGFVMWSRDEGPKWFVLSGICAGIAASCKYSGWAIPLFSALIFGWTSFRKGKGVRESAGKVFAYWLLAGVAGAWPHVRNALWTGDPFFPYLAKFLGRGIYFQEDWVVEWAGAQSPGFSASPWNFLLFPVLLVLEGSRYSGGHFFGPVALSFLPLLLAAFLKMERAVRMLVLVCAGYFAFIMAVAQQFGYLIPIFPVVLVLSLVGMWNYHRRRLVLWGCAATLMLYSAFGLSTLLVYAKDFLPVVVGAERKEAFLLRMASDYEVATFVNEHVPRGEKALVFIPHVYYLDGEYLKGNPRLARSVLPYSRIASAGELKTRLKDLGIRYVVKAGPYPIAVEGLFDSLENCCVRVVASRSAKLMSSRRRAQWSTEDMRIFLLK